MMILVVIGGHHAGSPIYYHAINEGLLEDVEDFYENKPQL